MTFDELKKLVNESSIPLLVDLKKLADMRLRQLKEEHDATARQLNIALGLAPRIRSDKGTKRGSKTARIRELMVDEGLTRKEAEADVGADPFAVFDNGGKAS